ncbi:MAG TPA: aminotransferase class V-fold PLP-dependent enzyme [Acidimicrobiales bacterium]|nr:aminotransferase class V-fold PLP-dependent enzyme [Acidimicrobiales bacterium]
MATPLPRDQFPVTERWNYLNHAGVCPLPAAAVDALAAYGRQAASGGSLSGDDRQARAEEVRAGAAGLMGVPVADVALVKNTTEGLGFVANGLTWQPGDRVVVPDLEFPSTVYPWLALADRGVVVELVVPEGPGGALPLAAFERAMAAGPAPKVVATSWVQFGRGWRSDLAGLAGLCRDAGSLLCADVIQGLGVVPADLAAWGVDFAMADAHKWLLGPEGIGALYVAAERLELLRPLEPGWASVAHREQWDNRELVWDEGARRLEGGSFNHAGIAAMGASIDLLSAAGIDAVWAHVDGLCTKAGDGLAAAGATVLSDRAGTGRSGILTFGVDGHDPAAVHRRLLDEGIVTSPRGGGIRIAPHGYTTGEEIDALVATVGQLGPGPGSPGDTVR